jgi:hypothetical protein
MTTEIAAACHSQGLIGAVWVGGALIAALGYFAISAYRKMEWSERTELLMGSTGVGVGGFVVAAVLTQVLS